MVRGLGSARAIRLLPGAIPAVAARRALRAAVVVPVTFMFGDLVLHDANVWLFAALFLGFVILFPGIISSAERDTKRVPVADIATIVTAVAALRRAADAICALWADDDASGGERTAARLEILQMTQHVATWFDKVATGLLDLAAMPQPLAEDGVAIRRLIAAVLDDLTDRDGRVADTAVAMVWTMDHLQAVRRLQGDLLPAAARAAATSNSTAPPRGGGRTFSLHSKTARRLARRRGASYDHV